MFYLLLPPPKKTLIFVENIPQKYHYIGNGVHQCMRLHGWYQCDDKVPCCKAWWKHNDDTYIYPWPNYVLHVLRFLVKISTMFSLMIQSLSTKLYVLFSFLVLSDGKSHDPKTPMYEIYAKNLVYPELKFIGIYKGSEWEDIFVMT